MKLVLIEWVDSQGPTEGWRYIEKEKLGNTLDDLRCQSAGFLAYDGKDCKRILPHISGAADSLQGRGDLVIPTKSILSIKELKTKP